MLAKEQDRWDRIISTGNRARRRLPRRKELSGNWAWRYDLLIGLATLARERSFRRRIVDLAQLRPAEAVLDVGCGTGTLAIVARERVGASGCVAGIDPSVQMIAHARYKATRCGMAINFQVGVIEQLAFPDQSFDVVLSTFM